MAEIIKSMILGLCLASFFGQSKASFRVPEKIEKRSKVCSGPLALLTGAAVGAVVTGLSDDGGYGLIVLSLTMIVSYWPYKHFLVEPYWVKWTALSRYNQEKIQMEEVADFIKRYQAGLLPDASTEELIFYKEKIKVSNKLLKLVIYEMQRRCNNHRHSKVESGISNLDLFKMCEALRSTFLDLLITIDRILNERSEDCVDCSVQAD